MCLALSAVSGFSRPVAPYTRPSTRPVRRRAGVGQSRQLLTLGQIRLPLCPPHLILALIGSAKVAPALLGPVGTDSLMITSQTAQLLEQT